MIWPVRKSLTRARFFRPSKRAACGILCLLSLPAPALAGHHSATTRRHHAAGPETHAHAARHASHGHATRHAHRHARDNKGRGPAHEVPVRATTPTAPPHTGGILTASHAHRRAEKPLVVIDPGHGGKDSGAIGLAGTLEKRIALETALTLRRLLEATGRYRVAMTRTTDRFVSLSDRVAFARSHHAALLISIHANASPDAGADGASVYVRTSRPEGDTITHVAAGPGVSSGIASALDPSSGSTPRSGSAWLQSSMINQLNDDIHLVGNPAREGRLYVLAARDIPGVLVEMGFVTNRHDETMLRRRGYRRKIAEALRDAIDDYYAGIRHPGASRT
ncbi:MAG TPA: N-acetylmuramoyl-L-alanine amidase [Rhodopila sp.]|nr:N-acetylmuramoyl-L-alanine amidase [Rhodopila sp.]